MCLDLIADVATHIHLVQAVTPRAATVEELKNALQREDSSLCTAHVSIAEGMKESYSTALLQGEILVICGSFYIMEEAMSILRYHPKDLPGLNETTLPSTLSSAFT